MLKNTGLLGSNEPGAFRGVGILGDPPCQPAGLWALGFDPLRPQYTGWAVWAAAHAALLPSRAEHDRARGNAVASPRRVLPPSRGTEDCSGVDRPPPCGKRQPPPPEGGGVDGRRGAGAYIWDKKFVTR